MSFILETRKNGKDTILFNDSKYRESYSVKSGDIVWRCLGKSCKAYVRTNQEKTAIYSSNETHSGQHPVTMRALTPTPSLQKKSPSPPTPIGENNSPIRTCTPNQSTAAENDTSRASESFVPTPAATRAPSAAPSATPACSSTPLVTQPIQPLQTLARSLAEENVLLNEEVTKLKTQLKCVLDHSVESDMRLLQFTDDIFVPNSSLQHSSRCDSKTDCGVQCDLPITCTDDRCAATRNLVSSLRTTIEVLEAEVKCLRAEAKVCKCQREEDVEGWTTVTKKKAPKKDANDISTFPTTSHKNNFALKYNKNNLTNNRIKSRHSNNIFKKTSETYTTNKAKAKRKSNEYGKMSQINVPFKSVTILGDSHARHISGLVKDIVHSETVVSGMCKPGAGLLSVTASSPITPPADHCYVLMAGSNDVASGRCDVIFERLETILLRYSSNSRVLISTLPHRHDLQPGNSVNKSIKLINSYIHNISCRHEGVDVLDVGCIQRADFTAHGMHLRARGKRLLSRLMAEKLATVLPVSSPTASMSEVHPDVRPNSTTLNPRKGSVTVPSVQKPEDRQPPVPLTLQNDTSTDAVAMETQLTQPLGTMQTDSYADVLKQGSAPNDLDLINQEYRHYNKKNTYVSHQTVVR